MDYGSSDTSTTPLGVNQFPISETWTPNAGFSALEGGPQSTDLGGKKSAPASMYVKDGNDVAQGQTTDAAVTGDTSGTLSAKLRGLLKIWTDIWDSVNHRIKVDGSGVTQPVSGSVSVSNFPGTQTVSGTVTANAGTGTFTNQQSNIQSDYDTSAGTQNVTMMGVALPASGGAVAGGTSSNPLRTDPTGTTTQPVSASSLPLPAGAAQEAGNLASIKTDADSIVTNTSNTATNTSNINTATGTKTDTKATDGSVTAWSVIALLKGIIDKLLSTLAVTQSGTWTVQPGNTANTTAWKVDGSGVTQPVSGTVTANAGTNLNTSLLALESGGHLANIDTHTPALGSAVSASSSPVVIASDQAPLVSATATRTNVTAAVADTSLLISNTSRKGAVFFNDSTAILYLAYGATAASTTSYSVQVAGNGYFELPPQPVFTGAIRGIWSAANGACRVTELS